MLLDKMVLWFMPLDQMSHHHMLNLFDNCFNVFAVKMHLGQN